MARFEKFRLKHRHPLLWIPFLFLISRACAAPLDSLVVKYEKGLNIDEWRASMDYSKFLSPLYLTQWEEILTSSRLYLNSSENKWKDKHQFRFELIRPIAPSIGYSAEIKSLIFTDQQTGFMNDVKTHSGTVGLVYSAPLFSLPVSAGVMDDRRFRQTDQGWTMSAGLEAPHIEWEEYHHLLSAEYSQDHLSPRQNNDLNLFYIVSKQFEAGTRDTLKYGYITQRRDYYFDEEGDIESRKEEGQSVKNMLYYQVSKMFRYVLKGELRDRKLSIDQITGENQEPVRDRHDSEIEGTFSLFWERPHLDGGLSLNYTEGEQTYQVWNTGPNPYGINTLKTPDNRFKHIHMTLENSWNIGRYDTLNVSASLEKYQYDTPDEANTDDRDEFRSRVDGAYRHRFSNEILLEVKASLHMSHLVYIFQKMSANNQWARLIRFKPKLIWNLSENIEIRHSAEVFANYVDYDFDAMLPDIRSFLYRKFRMDDTLNVNLSPRLTNRLIYRLELDENGKFIWSDWIEQKLLDRKTQAVQAVLDCSITPCLRISPGYSYYIRHGYRYSMTQLGMEKSHYEKFISHGPLIRFGYRGRNIRISASGSTIETETITRQKNQFTQIDLTMHCVF